MVRGCALIDSRLDTAKICSDGRVHVDHAQLPAVFGGEKTFSHGLGPTRTSRPSCGMSVLPPTTDIVSQTGYVRKVPQPDIRHRSQRNGNQLFNYRAAADGESDILLAAGHVRDR